MSSDQSDEKCDEILDNLIKYNQTYQKSNNGGIDQTIASIPVDLIIDNNTKKIIEEESPGLGSTDRGGRYPTDDSPNHQHEEKRLKLKKLKLY